MASIVVQRLSGESQSHPLSKKQPLAIGRHAASDVQIDEEDVAVLHARISWNRSRFEVTSASPAGVEVNGTPVRHAELHDGDVIRIGSADLTYFEEEPAAVGQSSGRGQSLAADSDEIGLRPISDEMIPVERPSPRPRSVQRTERVKERPQRTKEPAERASKSESTKDSSVRKSTSAPPPKSAPPPSSAPALPPRQPSSYDPGPLAPWSVGEAEDEYEKPPQPAPRPSFMQQVRQRVAGKPKRPGEQDPIRSPLVLTLTGGALVLLLGGAIIWFIIGRQSAQRDYDAAVAELEQGRFTQAIGLFEKFVEDRPRHALARDAWIGLGKARIERHIAGATPAWRPGMEALEQFIREHQDDPDFAQHHAAVRGYAEQIARGAARDAGTARNREFLTIAENASRLLDRYSPRDDLPVKAQQEIAAAMDASLEAIRKQETFDAATADIRQALENRDPMTALRVREELLDRYPDLSRDPAIIDLLASTLQAERSLVEPIEIDAQPLDDDRESAAPAPYVRIVHARLQQEDLPSERPRVIAVARDCCYGIDALTGEPVWRRVIGYSTPFFPMTVSSTRPGVLLFDTRHDELALLSRETGELIWRLPLGETISGSPLVYSGQIILPTRGGRLLKIDLETGAPGASLQFTQELHAPAALLADENHLVLAGDRSLLYMLTLRPLECRRVIYNAHQPGSIEAPLTPMGRLLLLAENDRAGGARLRVFDARDPETGLPQLATARVDGQVRDQPALRGNQLFVPSSGGRVTAFTVSDEPGQAPLTAVASYRLQGTDAESMYLSPGPDRQFWLTSTALRKMQLGSGEIKPDSTPVIDGTATQPLELMGNHLYLGRQAPYSGAVQFSRADRDTMVGDWQTILGPRIIAWTAAGGSALVCVGESGDVFRVSAADLERGGFDLSLTPQLNLPEDLREPLRATTLADGKIVVSSAGSPPRLWIVNAARQIERRLDLEQPLQAHPVALRDGLVLPLPGRLRLWSTSGSGARVEDYVAPVEMDQQPAWSHLLAADQEHVLAIDGGGRLARIQFRSAPVPHLFEVAAVDLGGPVDVAPTLHDGKLFVADGTRLQALDAANLEPLGEIELDAPATNAIWTMGERIYVESGRRTLHCFELDGEWKPVWSTALGTAGESLAGAPVLHADQLLISLQGGALWSLNPGDGTVQSRTPLPQPIERGPLPLGDHLIVAAADGSLYRVDPLLDEKE